MNVVLRTVLVLSFAGGVALLGWWMLDDAWQARRIAELEALRADLEAKIAEREAMLERLSRSRRLAHVEVTDQQFDRFGRVQSTMLRLIELDEDGRELGRQSFAVPGDILFIDTWTVKFEKGDVASGHPLRGHTIVLLRRIYSDLLPPREGFPIDTPGAVPTGYAAGKTAEFEQAIWRQFWQIATDPALAKEYGVRVAQGEVVYKPVRAGQTFELEVDASGGINFSPLTREHQANGEVNR